MIMNKELGKSAPRRRDILAQKAPSPDLPENSIRDSEQGDITQGDAKAQIPEWKPIFEDHRSSSKSGVNTQAQVFTGVTSGNSPNYLDNNHESTDLDNHGTGGRREPTATLATFSGVAGDFFSSFNQLNHRPGHIGFLPLEIQNDRVMDSNRKQNQYVLRPGETGRNVKQGRVKGHQDLSVDRRWLYEGAQHAISVQENIDELVRQLNLSSRSEEGEGQRRPTPW
ncbi:hypothetical protein EV424DRAFT_1580371 [Suillus variegatus]|nr:hypothetical protein EV424DRAFT_1580371 [Suillus variegatus]